MADSVRRELGRTDTFGPVPDAVIERVVVRVLGRSLRLRVWSPSSGKGALPLLLVHDGPEYAARAGLLQWAGATIEAGTVAPFRVVLLPPGDRNEWYSASAAYGRSLARRMLPALRGLAPVQGRPVGIGASLGALAMLQAQRAWPGTFAGLFLQSGSFFVPRLDSQESGFPRYGRIVRFVRGVRRATAPGEPVPVVMTCGTEEDNIHNNRLMAAALSDQGYPVQLAELPNRHDFESWRDGLHPHLTELLANVWPPR